METRLRNEGPLLEARMCEQFSKYGWDCNKINKKIEISPNSFFYPDITLSKDNHVYGFVDCYLGSITKRKLETVIFILEQYKPELFILTNGISYEVYFDCKYVGTMTVPMGYNEFKRLFAYASALGGEI